MTTFETFVEAFTQTQPPPLVSIEDWQPVDATRDEWSMVVGENGTSAHATLGKGYKAQLAEIFQWMRGTPEVAIQDAIQTYLKEATLKDATLKESTLNDATLTESSLNELFKLILFIREPRKGKGERLVVYTALLELYKTFPKTVSYVTTLLKDFGYDGDFEQLWNLTSSPEFKTFLEAHIAQTLQKDMASLSEGNAPSLMAKWAPTEKSNNPLAKAIAKILFPKLKGGGRFQAYRKMLTSLRGKINLVETHLCARTTAEISPGSIPSKAATLYSKALRNEKQSAYPKESRRKQRLGRVNNSSERFAPGHPNYEDRTQCKENITTFLAGGGQMKAGVADLYTIVEEIFSSRQDCEDPIRQSQWEARVQEIQSMILTKKTETPAYVYPNILSIVDLSGSMQGRHGRDKVQPIVAAIMLGLFTSQIQDTPLSEKAAPFANCFFGFSEEPVLFQIPRTSTERTSTDGTSTDVLKRSTLVECIRAMQPYQQGQYWGGSTDLYKVFHKILETGLLQKLRPEQMPQILAIYSDMQFNQADGKFTGTAHQKLELMYKAAGYTMPHIIYWNLRSDTHGYAVKATTPNTTLLSGFSTRMLDLFLEGSLQELASLGEVSSSTADTETETETETTSPTTLTLLEAALHHEMFESIQEELLKVIQMEFATLTN